MAYRPPDWAPLATLLGSQGLERESRRIVRALGVAHVTAAVAAAAAVLVAPSAGTQRVPLGLVLLLSLAVGVALLAGLLDQRGAGWISAVIATGTLLATLGGYYAGPGATTYLLFYLWTAPFAFCLRVRDAVLHVALVGISSALVLHEHALAVVPVDAWTDRIGDWVVTVATLVVVGLLIRTLVVSLRTLDDRLGAAFAQAPVGMALLARDGTFLQVNDALCRMLAYTRDELIGTSASDRTHEGDRAQLAAAVARAHANPGTAVELEKRCLPAGDRDLWAQLVLSRLGDAVLAQARDVTADHRIADGLLRDELTGLPTRGLALDRLANALREQGPGGSVAAVVIDIDRFGAINDSFGHVAGDRVLAACAARFLSQEPAARTVGRLGGDEFVAVYSDVRYPAEAVSLAQGLVATLEVPLGGDGGALHVSASAGVALSTSSSDPAELLRDALTALHRAKARARGTVELFDHDMRVVAASRLRLEQELATAIAGDQLRLHYQPIVDLRRGTTVGLEALVRWEHPERGLLTPDEFIPVAEDTGLIDDLGRWVVRGALAQLAAWRQTSPSLADLHVSVNVSPLQAAHPNRLLADIGEALAATPCAAGGLWVELTESTLAENAHVRHLLAELETLGVETHLDDFGTGYSSFGLLRTYPIRAIKIDRSFVEGIDQDPRDRALVHAMVQMARTLGLEVVAEGVERESQVAVLQATGCGFAQGYWFGRPSADPFALEAVARVPDPPG